MIRRDLYVVEINKLIIKFKICNNLEMYYHTYLNLSRKYKEMVYLMYVTRQLSDNFRSVYMKVSIEVAVF